METHKRTGRWLVSGVLGVMLGAAGCGTGATHTSQDGGPAVVLSVPSQAASAKAAPTKSRAKTPSPRPQVRSAPSADTPDRPAKPVPAAKPKPMDDSPDSPPSAQTP